MNTPNARRNERLLPALSALLLTSLVACSNINGPAPAKPAEPAVSPLPVASPAATADTRQTATPVLVPIKRTAPPKSFAAPTPIKFDDAITRAGGQLFLDAEVELGKQPRVVVIDPLIDANTGAQTVSTVKMGQQLEAILKKSHPGWVVKPLTRQTLAQKPLLLIGTLTPVTVERSIDTQPDAFRVWLTVIDLNTQRVVAKNLDRATVDSVNAEPLPYFRDSPTWHKDKTVSGYINSCQVNTEIGDPADPDYLSHLPAAAVINEAMLSYNDFAATTPRNETKLRAAQTLYKEAAGIAEPGDLRVLNGIYLTSWQLGQRDAAKDTFNKIVASGIEAKRLPMKLLFKPGTTNFNDVGDLSVQYDIWLASMAQEAGKTPACMKVVGHTSRTGSAGANERLSLRRAEAVAKLLESRDRSLRSRLAVGGVGSREALVGLGTDDYRDALDRRVEFRVVDCI